MAGQHFSERELALLCLNRGSPIAVSRFSLWSLASLLSQSPRHKNRRLQLLRRRRANLLLRRFRQNNLCRPRPRRNKRLHPRLPEASGSVSFLRQWTARSALGIYDQAGKLVRVLHQNAQLNDFTIGPDALVTRWDGKDDGHQDLPSGRYHARGYVVGPLKREDLGETSPPSTETEAERGKGPTGPQSFAER